MILMARRILVLGYGNPGRGDDGLGPALAQMVEKMRIKGVTVRIDYQLTVEAACDVAECDMVIFADAAKFGDEPFFLQPTPVESTMGWSGHTLPPGAVLRLAQVLYNARPEAYVAGVRGYRFDEFSERLSEQAEINLNKAAEYLAEWLKTCEVSSGP